MFLLVISHVCAALVGGVIGILINTWPARPSQPHDYED